MSPIKVWHEFNVNYLTEHVKILGELDEISKCGNSMYFLISKHKKEIFSAFETLILTKVS